MSMTPVKDITSFLDFVVRSDIHNQDLLNKIIKELDTNIDIAYPSADTTSTSLLKNFRYKLIKEPERGILNDPYRTVNLLETINICKSSDSEWKHDSERQGNLNHMVNTYYAAKIFLDTLMPNLRMLEDQCPELKGNYEQFYDCVLLSALFHDIGKCAVFAFSHGDILYDHGTYGRSIIRYLFEKYPEHHVIVRNMFYTASNHHCFKQEPNGQLIVKENLPQYMFQAWDYKPGKAFSSLREGKPYPGYEVPLVCVIVSLCDKMAAEMSMKNNFDAQQVARSANLLAAVLPAVLNKTTSNIYYSYSRENSGKWETFQRTQFKLVIFDKKQPRF